MKRHKQPNGFSLVEVAMAMAIAVFCLVTMMALLPVGLTSGRTTTGETAANGILNEVVADLRATGPTSPSGGAATSQQFGIAIPATGATSQTTLYFTPLGVSSPTLTADSRYRLTVTFPPLPSTAGVKAATVAIAKLTWPAPATNPSGVVETFVALDRN
jgi:uncharacterized protein (TIGR02598 family)